MSNSKGWRINNVIQSVKGFQQESETNNKENLN